MTNDTYTCSRILHTSIAMTTPGIRADMIDAQHSFGD